MVFFEGNFSGGSPVLEKKNLIFCVLVVVQSAHLHQGTKETDFGGWKFPSTGMLARAGDG